MLLNKFICRIGFIVLVSMFFQNNSYSYFQSPKSWNSEIVYFLLVDRFDNADISNDRLNGEYNTNDIGKVHGGDLKGVERRLDYIKNLGVTTVWLSPVMKTDGLYSGYAVQNFLEVEPRYGGNKALKSFVQAAHAKGMRVILDIQVNHSANLFETYDCNTGIAKENFVYAQVRGIQNKGSYSRNQGYCMRYRDQNKKHLPAFFQDPSNFHNYGVLKDYNDPYQRFLGEFPAGVEMIGGYDDFRTEKPEVRNALLEIYKSWISEFDVDGFRVDAIKHVEKEFFYGFVPAIKKHAAGLGKNNFLIFGEAFDGDDKVIAEYVSKNGVHSGFDSVINFPMHFDIRHVFIDGQSTKILEDRIKSNFSGAVYDKELPNGFINFVDNHDIPRTLNLTHGNKEILKSELVFLFGIYGVPQLYYGMEQDFSGGGTPFCHEDMWKSNFNTASEMYGFISKLSRIRKAIPALQFGKTISRWVSFDGPGLFVMSRIYGDQEAIVAVNSSNQMKTTNWNGNGANTGFSKGDVLVNALNENEKIIVGENTNAGNQINITIPAFGRAILLRQKAK